MQNIEIDKVMQCYKYRDLETAIFILSLLIETNPKYKLLYGILLYENCEYNRAIFHLNGLITTTAVYYRALCYKQIKKYKEAIRCLNMIQNASTLKDIIEDKWIQLFLIDIDNSEFFDQLLGVIYILLGQSREGIQRFKHVMFKNPLLQAAKYLIDENLKVNINKTHINDCVMIYYCEILKSMKKKAEEEKKFRFSILDTNLNNNISETKLDNKSNDILNNSLNSESTNLLQKSHLTHKNTFDNKLTRNFIQEDIFDEFPEDNFISKRSKIPYHGSYYLVEFANLLTYYNQDKKGITIYERLRAKDPTFMNEMDSYSTLLWKNKNENLLGLLAKDCIEIAPQHHNTWIVIGNYHSLKGKSTESLLCFRRSLTIRENTHAYTLLGFEYNARYQFVEAQECFKAAIAMSPNNDRALFGLGISYSEIFNKDLALFYFSKALQIHPYSIPMTTYLVRFHVKNGELDKSFEIIHTAIFKSRNIISTNFKDMVTFIEKNVGRFYEMEELMLCEFAEICYLSGHTDLATKILKFISCRTSTYFAKKSLIETNKT